jgi:hypothetical protein
VDVNGNANCATERYKNGKARIPGILFSYST